MLKMGLNMSDCRDGTVTFHNKMSHVLENETNLLKYSTENITAISSLLFSFYLILDVSNKK